jgi:hypothetical protein
MKPVHPPRDLSVNELTEDDIERLETLKSIWTNNKIHEEAHNVFNTDESMKKRFEFQKWLLRNNKIKR